MKNLKEVKSQLSSWPSVLCPHIGSTDLNRFICKTPFVMGARGVAAQRSISSAWKRSNGGIVSPSADISRFERCLKPPSVLVGFEGYWHRYDELVANTVMNFVTVEVLPMYLIFSSSVSVWYVYPQHP
jgi:hypothetical protein